jgi:hypothetical protein
MYKYRLTCWFGEDGRGPEVHPEAEIKALAPEAFNLTPESLFDCWTFETKEPIESPPRWVTRLDNLQQEYLRLQNERSGRRSARALRSYTRVAYGFVATNSDGILRDQTWEMRTGGVFRPHSFVVWEPIAVPPQPPRFAYVAGERRRFERAVIESLHIGLDEQLAGPVPAVVFAPVDVSPEQFLEHWLVKPRVPATAFERLVSEPVKASPGQLGLVFATAGIGVVLSVRFTGALLGLLLVGDQLEQTPDSARASDH